MIMSVSIIKKNSLYRILCLLFIIPSILILINLFRQHETVILPYMPIANGIKQGIDITKKDYTPRLLQPTSSTILRGILIYYPHHQESNFLPELLWFYRSWTEMMKYEPPLWRTDLLIYSGNFTSNLEQLGCIFNRIRIDRHESPQCRVFPYKPIHTRNAADTNYSTNESCQQIDINRSANLITYLREYEYVDSINSISECYPSFSQYDHILRTDMDVFLTHNFARFVPFTDTILTGQGGYSTPFNKARLGRVAKNINWSYANLTNIGSTW